MIYTFLAHCVLFAHLGFILFVLLGGFCVLREKRIAWIHAPAAIWGMLIEFFGWRCPLTPLEQWLRALSGQGTYSTGFIENILLALIYPIGLTRQLQFFFGFLVFTINCCIYYYAFLDQKNKISKRKSASGKRNNKDR